jgi:simple sugar transport system ATP-binding protein
MTDATDATPLLAVEDVSKHYGPVAALVGVTTSVMRSEVTCILGDNGAGKSTLIKILSGLIQPDPGAVLRMDGVEIPFFRSPAEARDRGISTVYQDLALVPLLPLWRNFFLGLEPTQGRGPFKRLDVKRGKAIALAELEKMGIAISDPERTTDTLSGGQRQSVATARAVYFGARVLILDEPTAALGVRQSGMVLRHIVHARERGLGTVFITHNPAHAYLVGDRFVLLKHGRCVGDYRKADISRNELIVEMSAGAELDQLQIELEGSGRDSLEPAVPTEKRGDQSS